MTDLKTYALAAALLMLIPLGLAQMEPDQLIIEGGLNEVADITDVTLADLTPKTLNDSTLHEPERLVEGHTVFVTITMEQQVIVQNGSVDITGFASCTLHTNATGPLFFGVVVPDRIHQAHEECHVGDRVIVTPDPFDGSGLSMSTPQPTGVVIPFMAPNGESAYAEEFSYVVSTFDVGGGLPTEHTRYAWAVPILDTWTDNHGRAMDIFAPLPNDRLTQMDATNFHVVLEKNFPHG